MNRLWHDYKVKLQTVRPFLRTKNGRILGLLGALDFLILFLAPLIHGFVGTALFGCVASVLLILIWRRYDREHAAVPAVLLCIPLLLDMLIYRHLDVTVGCLIAVVALLAAAYIPKIKFYDGTDDLITALLIAGALCVGVVAVAGLTLFLVRIAWWIICIVAFLAVVAIFMGVVFSTAAYTASDGRRQARRRQEREHESADSARERRYRDYRPKNNSRVYDLDDDDMNDID